MSGDRARCHRGRAEGRLSRGADAARAIPELGARSQALGVLALGMAEPEREAALREARVAVGHMKKGRRQTRAFADLVPKLTEPVRSVVALEALEAARRIPVEKSRYTELWYLARRLAGPEREVALRAALDAAWPTAAFSAAGTETEPALEPTAQTSSLKKEKSLSRSEELSVL